MKYLIFTFLFIQTIFTFAQKQMTGKYFVPDSMGNFWETIEFKKNKEFYYETGGHLGIQSYGSGTYNFENNLLILNFNNTDPIDLSYYKSKFWVNQNEEAQLRIFVRDFKGEIIPNATILVENSNIGVAVNDNGYAELNLSKQNEASTLIVSSLGYIQEKLQFRRDFNYEINVFLKEGGMSTPILNEVDTLKVFDKKEKEFKTIDKKGVEKIWIKS